MLDKQNPVLWQPVEKQAAQKNNVSSHPYWYQVLRAFCKDKLAVIGAGIMVFIVLFALVGPLFAVHTAEEMELELGNISPRLSLYRLPSDTYLYLHPDYYFIRVSEDGHILERIRETSNDTVNRTKEFTIDEHIVMVDYSFVAKAKAEGITATQKYAVYCDGAEIQVAKTVWNKTYILGSDSLGRDLFARILEGAQVTLLIAVCSTLINTVIGILYGGISGYCGGRTDQIMMRIVEILSTLPVTLIVIMLMVVIGSGVLTLIIAMGIANWCTMARVVRGQVLSLKQREFILSAVTVNASKARILVHHLIPNIAASIVVCMTMLVPGAIFNESFLSFIGLGVTTASWGTLVKDGLAGFRSFPYQVMFPAIAICLTILSMNLIGNGLQAAVQQYEER